MKKLEKTKANPLDQVNKRIEKYVELYDSPMIHDPMTTRNKNHSYLGLDKQKPTAIRRTPKKNVRPITITKIPFNIDISGINAEVNKYEKAIPTPRPDFKLRKDDELEGIETILGIKA